MKLYIYYINYIITYLLQARDEHGNILRDKDGKPIMKKVGTKKKLKVLIEHIIFNYIIRSLFIYLFIIDINTQILYSHIYIYIYNYRKEMLGTGMNIKEVCNMNIEVLYVHFLYLFIIFYILLRYV